MQFDIDLELWAMRLMDAEELDRFTGILETIEKENAWLSEWEKRPCLAPDAPLPAKERDEYLKHRGNWLLVIEQRLEMIGKYSNQTWAWGELIDYSYAAIEELYNKGKFDGVKELGEFWRLVYRWVLEKHGTAMRKDARWQNVRILSVLKEIITPLLPGFAEKHFRQKRNNPILAQYLESLAN